MQNGNHYYLIETLILFLKWFCCIFCYLFKFYLWND